MNTKTLAELQKELALVEEALKETRKHANERATATYQLQVVQTAVILGKKEKHELLAAQDDLQACVDSLVKVPLLEQAVADAQRMVEEKQFQERREHVDGIKTEYEAVWERYVARSKDVLGIFRELQRLDTQYRALARTGSLPELLAPYHRELNLPAVTGALATRSGFATGQE